MLDEESIGAAPQTKSNWSEIGKFSLVLLGFNGAIALTILGTLGGVWDLHFVRDQFIASGFRFGQAAIAAFGAIGTSLFNEIRNRTPRTVVSKWTKARDKLYNWIAAISVGGFIFFGLGFMAAGIHGLAKIWDCTNDDAPAGCERQVERQIERRLPPALP